MFNGIANLNVATPVGVSDASPLSTLVNNGPDANGQPVFWQVVRDALNRTTNDTHGQETQSPQSKDSTSGGQAPSLSILLSRTLLVTLDSLKQSNKPQAKPSSPSSSDSASNQNFLVPVQSSLLPIVPQSDLSAAAPSQETNRENSNTTQITAQSVSEQVSQGTSAEHGTMQISTQQQPQIPVVSLVSAAALNGEDSTLANSPNVANPASASMTSPLSGGLSAATLAAEAATTIPAATIPAIPVPVVTQKPQVSSQISNASPILLHGQPISSVLQQLAQLQGPAANREPVPSVVIDLARTTVQSQLAQAAANTALTASSGPSTSDAAGALVVSEVKSTQVATLTAHSVNASQDGTPITNNHPASQDSSSDHGKQSASDSLTTPDSSVTVPATMKAAPSAFSDALSAVAVPKPDAAQAAQSANGAPAPIATLLPSTDPSIRPSEVALPSAPAQAQAPIPTLHVPDAPSGRFVNDAQLTNAAGQSEMHIAMQTEKLGAIELHARVSGDEVGAAIIVEKRDAHAALAVELPALQHALSEKQLRVEQVALSQGSLSSTAGDAGANTQHGQRGPAQSPRSVPFWNESRTISTAAWFVPEQAGIFTAQGRLSVQA